MSNMEQNAIDQTAERLAQWDTDETQPTIDAERMTAGELAAVVVADVLDAFGIKYEPTVDPADGGGAQIGEHERLLIRARPGSQFRIVANDGVEFPRYRDGSLVDLIFHAFGDRVSNTTLFIGARAALAPAIPTVAYWGDKPTLRKYR